MYIITSYLSNLLINGFSVIIAVIAKRKLFLFSRSDPRWLTGALNAFTSSVRTPPNRGPPVTPPLLTGEQPVKHRSILSFSLSLSLTLSHFTPSCADRPNFLCLLIAERGLTGANFSYSFPLPSIFVFLWGKALFLPTTLFSRSFSVRRRYPTAIN